MIESDTCFQGILLFCSFREHTICVLSLLPEAAFFLCIWFMFVYTQQQFISLLPCFVWFTLYVVEVHFCVFFFLTILTSLRGIIYARINLLQRYRLQSAIWPSVCWTWSSYVHSVYYVFYHQWLCSLFSIECQFAFWFDVLVCCVSCTSLRT